MTHRAHTTPDTPASPGFSLIELTVSLAIMSILVAAIGSIIILSSKAIPREDGEFAAAIGGAMLAERFIDDAALATSFSELTPSAITFTIPDRDGSGDEETIRYAWSGNAGDPLVWTINGSPPMPLVPDVRSLTFLHTLRQGAVFLGGDTTASSGNIQAYNAALPLSQVVNNSNWFGFYCPPPADATVGWRITRVTLSLLRSGSSDGKGEIQLRKPDASGRPTSTTYATVPFNEDDFGLTPTSRNFDIDSGVVPAGQGICIVIRGTSGSNGTGVAYFSALNIPPGTIGLTTTNAGSTWSIYSNTSPLHDIVGIVYSSDQGVQPREFVDTLTVRLRAGAPQTAVELTVRPLNRPEVGP